MTNETLPSGGGAYVREKDGTLRRIEEPTAPSAEPVEAPVEGGVKPALKTTRKEA